MHKHETLEAKIGYQFKEHSNLEKALTHSSVRPGAGQDTHYERLEFLGDRVLGLCVAEMLHREFPKAKEGELSLRLNTLVRGETLTEIADQLQLHEFIRTGGDVKSVKGQRMQGVRADVVEALIASIYLDGGLAAATDFIKRFWSERLHKSFAARRDSKTALQEWAHANQLGTPTYSELERVGPDHEPIFTVSVELGGVLQTEGTGRSKRIAEQDAARKLLLKKKVWDENDG